MDLVEAFQVVGVSASASRSEVRSAYRDLIKVWHPDRFIGDTRLQAKANAHLMRITTAYGLLDRDHFAQQPTPSTGYDPRRHNEEPSRTRDRVRPPPPAPPWPPAATRKKRTLLTRIFIGAATASWVALALFLGGTAPVLLFFGHSASPSAVPADPQFEPSQAPEPTPTPVAPPAEIVPSSGPTLLQPEPLQPEPPRVRFHLPPAETSALFRPVAAAPPAVTWQDPVASLKPLPSTDAPLAAIRNGTAQLLDPPAIETRPTNGQEFVAGSSPGKAKLTIVNGGAVDAVVMLHHGGDAERAIYVHGGETAVMEKIAHSAYSLTFESGQGWSDEQRAFTRNVRDTDFLSVLDFTEQQDGNTVRWHDHRITLHRVAFGNALTETSRHRPKIPAAMPVEGR